MSEQADETQADETQADETQADETQAEPEPDADEEGEAEQAESPLEQDESQPPEPESAGISQAEAEKRIGRMEKRATTWRNTVSDVLGEMALDMEPCPRCLPFAPGFILPASLAPLLPEQKAAVLVSVGEMAPRELRQDKDAWACDACGGYGMVLTGSLREPQREKKCLTCNGDGWIGPRKDAEARQPVVEQTVIDTNGHAEQVEAPAVDMWQRPRGHPGYMVMPYDGMPHEQAPAGWAGATS